jgi:hypothetical protein
MNSSVKLSATSVATLIAMVLSTDGEEFRSGTLGSLPRK